MWSNSRGWGPWNATNVNFRFQPTNYCRKLKSKTLNYCNFVRSAKTELFCFSLTPQTIKITMKSEDRFKSVTNTFFYSVDPICPLNVFPYMQNSEEIVSKEILYCGLHYLKLGSSRKWLAFSNVIITVREIHFLINFIFEQNNIVLPKCFWGLQSSKQGQSYRI